MKKTFAVLPLAAFGITLLAGCNNNAAASNSSATPMQQEIVSAALLVDPTAQNSYLRAKAETAKNPIEFDPNNIGASLASMDALSLSDYGVTSTTLTSDRDAYANEEEIVYSLPDGSEYSIFLYYGDPKKSSTVVSASSTTSGDSTSDTQNEEEKNLHGFGFRSGAFNEMLSSGMKIDDYDNDENATIEAEWKSGLAVIESQEYRFYSEHLKVTKTEDSETKVSEFSSFGLFNRGSFLAIEQIAVVDGTERENAYAYTSFQKGGYVRFLLSEAEEKARFVYLTPAEKMVITRFEKDNATRYAIRVKVVGSMSFVGIYEKKVVTAEDGSTTTTYELVSKNEAEAPEED